MNNYADVHFVSFTVQPLNSLLRQRYLEKRQRFLTGGESCIQIWDSLSDPLSVDFSDKNFGSLYSAIQLHDKRIALGFSRAVVFIDHLSFKVLATVPQPRPSDIWTIYQLNNRSVITSSSEGYINRCYLKTMKLECMLETGVNIRQFLQLQDGSLLIASTEKYIQMWDIQKLKSKITDLHGHSLCVRQMIQINNSSFVSSGDDQYLIFWDIPTRSQRKKVNIQCQCWKLLLLKDNTFVAAGANTAPSFFNINGENVEKRGVTGSSYITSACEFDKYIVCGANSRVLVLEKDTGELVKEYTKNMKSFVRVAFNLQ